MQPAGLIKNAPMVNKIRRRKVCQDREVEARTIPLKPGNNTSHKPVKLCNLINEK
ncbi:hypothetical protein CCY16_00978 [Wolbachia endosymbiont of Wuchereria bancrofti]|nr:hypothetical protein CCY16_00978 [Wolbachia endosymbiont of Wuchereria bancrofti]